MATVVSFINYKGGVGKTTTAYHVSCSLAQHHRQRVLMIDIDPQTNLTFLCAEVEQWQHRKRTMGTIVNLYRRFTEGIPLEVKRYTWKDAVTIGRYPISGLDMIPCDIDLLGEDLGETRFGGEFTSIQALRENAQQYMRERLFLSKVIEEVEDMYDWVVIDCPPNLYLMTQNALHASDYYVVTAIPDHLSTIGLSTLNRKIDEIGRRIAKAQPYAGANSGRAVGKLGAIVFVKVRIGGSMITNTHYNTITSITNEYSENKVVSRHTTELIGYSEAAQNLVPVWEHQSKNARLAARKNEYPEITRELIGMLGPSP
ncbi:MAG: AAA family ATPase [Chloroflexota bacterium]|nr:AAA family ATPase [Chloroflexota bacterium]